MLGEQNMASRQKTLVLILITVFVAGSGEALHTGVGGNANGQGDVALAGCTCHSEEPDNSVTVILDGVPFHYSPETTYEMKLQLIGGPEANLESYTGGFSMRVASVHWDLQKDSKNWSRTGKMTLPRSLTQMPAQVPLTDHGRSVGLVPQRVLEQ